MLTDAHTHLNSDQLYPQRQDHLQSFVDVGGRNIAIIGVDHERNERAVEIAYYTRQSHPDLQIGAVIGVHPGETCFTKTITSSEQIEERIQQVFELYQDAKQYVYAIGEAGTDLHYEDTMQLRTLQHELFDKQCFLARQLELPIVIHSRSDFTGTFDVIKHYPDLKVYFHCRGYGPTQIDLLLQHLPHMWIGFCGNTTYKNATSLRESLHHARQLQSAGKLHVLLETDAPYLTPQAVRGETNQPSFIQHLYEYVSLELDLPQTKLEEIIAQNFTKLYF